MSGTGRWITEHPSNHGLARERGRSRRNPWARLVLGHPDVHGRLPLVGLFVVAVGCGTFADPAESGEPSSDPAPATGAEDPPAQALENGSSQAATEPAPNAGEQGATPTTPRPCKVGFEKDILPRLAATCGQSTCHGAQMNRPFIEAGSAKTTHDELMEFEFGSIEWSDPHSDYSGAGEADFKKAIGDWRMCGAPLD